MTYYCDPKTGELIPVSIGARVGNMVYISRTDGRMLRFWWAGGWYSYASTLLVGLDKVIVASAS